MALPRRPAPAPLEANDRLVTGVITAGWAVALAVALILRGHIPPADRWWIWTCAAGVAMGVFGLWYVPRLKSSRGLGGRGQRRPSESKIVSSTDTPGRSTRS